MERKKEMERKRDYQYPRNFFYFEKGKGADLLIFFFAFSFFFYISLFLVGLSNSVSNHDTISKYFWLGIWIFASFANGIWICVYFATDYALPLPIHIRDIYRLYMWITIFQVMLLGIAELIFGLVTDDFDVRFKDYITLYPVTIFPSLLVWFYAAYRIIKVGHLPYPLKY